MTAWREGRTPNLLVMVQGWPWHRARAGFWSVRVTEEARPAQTIQPDWELDQVRWQVQKLPGGLHSQPALQAYPAAGRGREFAEATAASPHGRPVPFQFPAARGEQGGFPLADAGPAFPEAVEWGER